MLRAAIGCVIAATALAGSPATADVFEVSPDGAVSVRAGAGVATWEVLDTNARISSVSIDQTIVPSNAMTMLRSAAVPQRFAGMIQVASASSNISPALLAALVSQESGWNPQAVSPKGAFGLTQLMPATARELGVDPRDPVANLIGGSRYLRQLLDVFDGDVEKALAAYNAGPLPVRRANGVPAIAETRSYVRSIVQRVSLIRQEVR